MTKKKVSPEHSSFSPMPQEKPKEGSNMAFKNSDKTSDHSSNDAFEAKML